MRVLLGILLMLVTVGASAETIPFDSNRWVGISGEVAEHDGRLCRTGAAYLPNIAFENGVIEYDVMLDGSRGYPGVTFRAASRTHYEHIYIRPHAGLRGDGLQYAPAFGPGSDWQLYHGPGYTASIAMPAGRWIHVRIEVLGPRARVFYDGAAEPTLIIDDLKHEPRPGPIAIRSAPNTSARFADFQVEKTEALDFPEPAPRPRPARGLVRQWEISQPFLLTDVDASAYPQGELAEQLQWQTVEAEDTGLLNLSRHARRSVGGQGDVVFARIDLSADRTETRRFSFGYSDYVTVFLNGKPLFSGDNAYRSRNDDHPGVVSLDDQVHLHLEKGSNELLFAVAETFGGWGLMGQDNDADFVHESVSRLWRLEPGNRLPEAVVYDARRDEFYVSQFFQGGNEFLSRVSSTGEVLQREWVGGLKRPTGLALDGDTLWVVQRTGLVEIDVAEGRIIRTHAIPDAGFPNDVTRADDRSLYVTDTAGSKIYRFAADEFSVWLSGPEVRRPNGILYRDGKLLYGHSDDGCLQEASLTDKTVRTVCELGPGQNVDGICSDGAGGLILSAFDGLVVHRAADGTVIELLDLSASEGKTADLVYVPEKELLVVPGLYDNRLTAYRYAID